MSTVDPTPHLLIVEDDPTNALIAATICERAGYATTLARNGLEALEHLKQRRFDLLLVDVQMPVMDGLTLVKRLRAEPATAELPIIAVTAKAGLTEQRQMLAAGMTAVITKPYHNRQLRQAIAEALEAS